MRRFLSLLLVLSAIFADGQIMNKLTGRAYGGIFIPFNDLPKTDFSTYRINYGFGVGLDYDIGYNLKVRGDLLAGIMNGSSDPFYYESNVIEPQLSVSYNILPLLSKKESAYKLEIIGGAGMLFYYSKLYRLDSRDLVAESPNPGGFPFSPNGFVNGGIDFSIPLSRSSWINAGYTQRYAFDAEFIDAFASGDAPDQYGFFHVGFKFDFVEKRDRKKIELDRRKYNKMVSTIDSLAAANSQISGETVDRLEMESREKDLMIQGLQLTIDSLRANVTKVADDGSQPATEGPDSEALLSSSMHRIIVASMPSRPLAQRWIDRSNLDKSEMIIVYVEALDTYRIVYKSFPTHAAAKKELQQIKSNVSDAWIIKF